MCRTWLWQRSYELDLDCVCACRVGHRVKVSALPADQVTVKIIYTASRAATPGSAYQPLDDTPDLPAASPPTRAVRAKRAFRSAPVVLVRSVRMPAYAETGASFVLWHGSKDATWP
jgi:hypothetical protein